jgi:2-C-methyl-D-erythritol 4-phosphate cytidylyltransferase
MISLILLAGGIGTRMGSSIPKQYLPLQGKPLALHSFDLFLQIPEIQEIIVVCEPQYQHFFKHPVLFASPGPRRQDSVYSGLLKCSQDIIFIHDAARPLIEAKYLPPLLEAAQSIGAAALGVPVTNTIKQCSLNQIVEKTLNRAELYEIQTPQAIQRALLLQAFAYVQKEGLEVTDDLSLIEALGVKPKIIPSSPRNIKITTPFDLFLAEKLCDIN